MDSKDSQVNNMHLQFQKPDHIQLIYGIGLPHSGGPWAVCALHTNPQEPLLPLRCIRCPADETALKL